MHAAALFKTLDATIDTQQKNGLIVTSPADGAVIATLGEDTAKTLEQKLSRVSLTQKKWGQEPRARRVQFLQSVSAAIKQHRESLAQLITLEAGKTGKEALGEVDSSADVILKTIKDTTLDDLSGMRRVKERPPVGVVGLITSFNFPLVVANWTLAPALLAGNGVLWKPSEKTPLTALAYKSVFDTIAGDYADLLQVLIGGRDIGNALVAHEQVDMISATGSVAMGKGIKATLAKKNNNDIKPILELGGNNGVIISEKLSADTREWAMQSIMHSYLGTTGQRCTNTRRVIVHRSHYDALVALFEKQLNALSTTDMADTYGYGPLIDKDAFSRFEQAKARVLAEGGKILLGKRLRESECPHGYYVEPALALLPAQSEIMHEETFAPLLFITPYDGDIAQAVTILNAPANAGLTNGIYTQSQREADYFAAHNGAGHSLINSPKGTGTPAFGMGFGGNKASGEGEILNSADPLRAFTRDTSFHRIAQNADIAMDRD